MASFFRWVLDGIKNNIQQTKEYYRENLETADPQAAVAIDPSDTPSWQFDNDKSVADMSKREQHDRAKAIEEAMLAFPFLPFQIGDSFLYRSNTSATGLNMSDQKVVSVALAELNQLITDFYNNDNVIIQLLPKELQIPIEKVCYGFPSVLTINDKLPRSFVEYRPYTRAGKHSTTPLFVHFTTIEDYKEYLNNEAAGRLEYGVDGNVRTASISIFRDNQAYNYKFGLVGRTFTITKIDTISNKTGNRVQIYQSAWDFIEY